MKASNAPYGYKKDPSDRHRLVIDERYAPTVRMIFSLAKDGMGISQIRNYINSRHILRLSAVNPNGYGHYFSGEDDPKRYEWSNNSVRGILRNPVYAGHLVMGKRVKPSFKSHKSFSVLPENYKVVKNVHQLVVDPADFELVQRMITSRRNNREKARKLENIFAGIIKCADCGYAMTLAKARLSEVDNLFQSLYEDKLNGKISERNYQMMSRRYEEEQDSLEQAISDLETQQPSIPYIAAAHSISQNYVYTQFIISY